MLISSPDVTERSENECKIMDIFIVDTREEVEDVIYALWKEILTVFVWWGMNLGVYQQKSKPRIVWFHCPVYSIY